MSQSSLLLAPMPGQLESGGDARNSTAWAPDGRLLRRKVNPLSPVGPAKQCSRWRRPYTSCRFGRLSVDSFASTASSKQGLGRRDLRHVDSSMTGVPAAPVEKQGLPLVRVSWTHQAIDRRQWAASGPVARLDTHTGTDTCLYGVAVCTNGPSICSCRRWLCKAEVAIDIAGCRCDSER